MNLLFLTLVFPLVSFLILAFSCGRWSENLVAMIGVGSIGLSMLITIWVGLDFFYACSNTELVFIQTLWHWISIDSFHIPITLSLDGLSLTMLSVVTGVGFFIHLYASWYMRGEEGYSRFFAYTNLFIASMLILVLADNLLLMYLGWEGVGMCSYLLIGFYYSKKKNLAAAMKAFIVTRIGDILLLLAIFIIYNKIGTLNFHDLIILAPQKLKHGSPDSLFITLMLLGGAVGKSAQLPLHTWLADAMAGPTPVSALIHATTMVTAGVYLIARTHGLFLMAPDILYLVSIIGAITLVLASFAAIAQTDIKRILAYSTMSQVGYMFLALGMQSWNAAIYHLMTHSFFKSLLFLSSGSVIIACNYEQNIFKMGGLRKKIPIVYLSFLIGGAALSALPLVTAGFYSKGQILSGIVAHGQHNVLMFVSLIGALLTSVYIFRLIFIVFHGNLHIKTQECRGISHHLPLVVLMILSTFIGAWITPPLADVIPGRVLPFSNLYHANQVHLEILSSAVTIIGILLSAILWLGDRRFIHTISNSITGRFFLFLWFYAWGFDWLYNKIFVQPYLAITRILKRDPINSMINIPAQLTSLVGINLKVIENGQLRWYMMSLGFGVIIVISILVYV